MKYVPMLLLLLLLFDLLVFLVLNDRRYRNNSVYLQKRRTAMLLVAFAALASFPLFTDYMVAGHDIQFHLFRIEGIVDGLMDGQFPVRIHPGTLYGNGYANPIFYPELLLYFPALLRLCGFSLMEAYQTSLFCLNLLTAAIAYFSFSRMFRSARLGLVGSGFYTLSLYRLVNLYTRAAIGEASAMTFLPLVAYGVYAILADDTARPGYRWAFLPLLAGMTGLVGTHLLSCEMVLPLLAIVCLICWKRTVQPRRLLAILKAAGGTLLLSLCFFVPMLDCLGHDVYQVFTYSVTSRAAEALNAAQLFVLLPNGMGESNPAASGIANEMPLGVGFVFLLVLIAYPLLRARARAVQRNSGDDSLARAVRVCYGLAVVLLIMTTNLFPWEGVYGLGGVAASLASLLQFPWRLLAPATVLLVVVACHLFTLLPAALPDTALPRAMLAYTLCLFALLTPLAYGDRLLQQAKPLRAQSLADLDPRRSVGDAEYLPLGARGAEPYLVDQPLNAAAGLAVQSFSRAGTHIDITVSNPTDSAGTVDLPLIYYLGYAAADDAGRALALSKGEACRIRLTVPAGYAGTVSVRFVEPALWRAAEAVTLLTAAALAAAYLRFRRKTGATPFRLPVS